MQFTNTHSAHWCTTFLQHVHDLTDEIILPRRCPVCGNVMHTHEQVVCGCCLALIPYTHFGSALDNIMIRTLWPQAPIERATSLFYYRPLSGSRKLIIDIKYHHCARLAERLGEMAAKMLCREWDDAGVDAIVAVPIHWRKKMKRGYNQAERIAWGIGRAYGLPVVGGMLRRNRLGISQTRLNEAERKANATNTYHATVPPEWRGRHLMIVDDVCTTGATLTACAHALLAADPTLRISCFTMAFSGDCLSYRKQK